MLKAGRKIAVISLVLYIKSCEGKGGCQNDWDPEVNECTSCNIFDEQGYEGIQCKGNLTEDTADRECQEDENGYGGIHCEVSGKDDTIRKCLPGKVQLDKNFSKYAFECMVEQECPKDFSSSLGKCSVVEHMYIIERNAEDVRRPKVLLRSYESTVLVQCIIALHCTKELRKEIITLCRSLCYVNLLFRLCTLIGSTFKEYSRPNIPTNISDLTPSATITSVTNSPTRRDKHGDDAGLSTVTGSDFMTHVTSSSPTNKVDTSPPRGETSYIGLTLGSILIFLAIITAVCVKCGVCKGVDRILRTQDMATENEPEPLHNHNGATYIPMEDLNVNRTPVPGELQESDPNNHNGNVNSNPESPERQSESETEGMTGSQSNDSFHAACQFCRCCDLHWTRCKKRNKEQRIAPVQPQQSVNEMPTNGTEEVEVLVDAYSDFSSSIFHHPESHGSTSTVDEETTHVKTVYSNEQVPSTVDQINDAEGTCFEESQQADLHNEEYMTTGIPAEDDLSQAHSLLGRTNHDQE